MEPDDEGTDLRRLRVGQTDQIGFAGAPLERLLGAGVGRGRGRGRGRLLLQLVLHFAQRLLELLVLGGEAHVARQVLFVLFAQRRLLLFAVAQTSQLRGRVAKEQRNEI